MMHKSVLTSLNLIFIGSMGRVSTEGLDANCISWSLDDIGNVKIDTSILSSQVSLLILKRMI